MCINNNYVFVHQFIFLSQVSLFPSLEVNTTVLFDVNRSPHVVVSIEVRYSTWLIMQIMTVLACIHAKVKIVIVFSYHNYYGNLD